MSWLPVSFTGRNRVTKGRVNILMKDKQNYKHQNRRLCGGSCLVQTLGKGFLIYKTIAMQQLTICLKNIPQMKTNRKYCKRRAKCNPGDERTPSNDLMVASFNFRGVKETGVMPEDWKRGQWTVFIYT